MVGDADAVAALVGGGDIMVWRGAASLVAALYQRRRLASAEIKTVHHRG